MNAAVERFGVKLPSLPADQLVEQIPTSSTVAQQRARFEAQMAQAKAEAARRR